MLHRSHVAVPSGLRQGTAAKQDARAADQPLFHGLGQPKIGAAGITNRREPAIQCLLEIDAGMRGSERLRHAVETCEVDVGRYGMPVGVDEAGH